MTRFVVPILSIALLAGFLLAQESKPVSRKRCQEPFFRGKLTDAVVSQFPPEKKVPDTFFEKPVPKKKEDYKGNPTGRMVHYSGKVQGVGFRATTESIARDYPVTGWVKNLEDGRVQLLVEGPADAVDDFLKAVRFHWKKNIEKEQSEEQKVTGKYKSFTVKQ